MTAGLPYLAASVACSVTVAVLLKLARGRGIDLRQSIAANYPVAAVLCCLTLRPTAEQVASALPAWPMLLALGVLLPGGFLAMAESVRHAGIVRSDAAQRLSLVIPLLAAFALFGEPLDAGKAAAVAMAFAALFCILRRRPVAGTPAADGLAWMWPLGVWVAYGTVDALFKQMAKSGAAFPGALLAAFALAALVSAGWLAARGTRWQARPLLAGVLLGLLNFLNIVTYIRAHQALPDNPALVFSAMNMGVITLGTLVGALVFREPLSRLNLLGLGLAVTAIWLMMP